MRRPARHRFALVPASSSVKPCCIAAYNRYMGGVDISDRKIYHVSAERPSKRYWKKIFFTVICKPTDTCLVATSLKNRFVIFSDFWIPVCTGRHCLTDALGEVDSGEPSGTLRSSEEESGWCIAPGSGLC